MSAAVLTRPRRRSGLRPLDQGRDLTAIADLIENAFPTGIDAAGQRMLREMRWLGRGGWIGGVLCWLLLPGSPYTQGFVWEEGGRVVGNASLMRVEGHPGRWVMANVAVHPEFRQRGIGRALVQASVHRVKENGGSLLILQVESGNRIALGLYDSLGFSTLARRTLWERPSGRGSDMAGEPGGVRTRRPEEWRLEWALASRLHPEGLIWPHPLEADIFRSVSLVGALGREVGGHWAWPSEGEPLAFLTARAVAEPRGWRLILLVDPSSQGKAEEPLLARAINRLGARQARLTLEHPAGSADDAFARLGFRAERNLTWMGLPLRRQD